MKKAFKKILERLEREIAGKPTPEEYNNGINRAYSIVQKVAEEYNNGWIPCGERLPDNAEHKGSICPRYHVITIYGQTVGWFNPDYDSWFVLVWYMTARYLESEIDMERGDIPKVARVPLEYGIVTAWQPLSEPYPTKESRTILPKRQQNSLHS